MKGDGAMTQREARELELEKRYFFLANPDASVEDLPKRIYDQVKGMRNNSPLCELFYTSYCPRCPLIHIPIYSFRGLCTDRDERRIRLLEAWNPEE